MSAQKQMIDIRPTKYKMTEEKYYVYNHDCPACNGRGSHIIYEGRESRRKACDRCDGTGRLKAEITILWTPDYSDN